MLGKMILKQIMTNIFISNIILLTKTSLNVKYMLSSILLSEEVLEINHLKDKQ